MPPDKKKKPPFPNFTLLPRKKRTDKSQYGHVLVLSGSKGMSGAPQLVSRACLTSGAGLVTAAFPKSVREAFSKKALAEVMCFELPQTSQGALAVSALKPILAFIKKRRISCLAVGPGLTHEKETGKMVRQLVDQVNVPVVLDADGLNVFSAKGGSASGGKGYLHELKRHRSALVLTPHEGEFMRLFGEECPRKTKARADLAKKLSKFYDVTIVLKGHRTLVVSGDRRYENRTGNPGMAKGGSGDVLTGILAAFIAQGLTPFEAACWAVYFHGKAGDAAVKEKGELSLLASDIIDFLPKAFKS